MSFVDPIEESRQRFRRAMETGVVENPDQLAQDRREAEARGVTVPMLRDARAQRPLPPLVNFQALEQNSPRLTEWLSDPANAAVAHDDLGPLETIENVVRGVGARAVNLTADAFDAFTTYTDKPLDALRGFYDRLGIPQYDILGTRIVDGQLVVPRQNVQAEIAAIGGVREQRLADQGQAVTFGYVPGTTWEEVKARPVQSIIPFALEQGIVSLPDMALAVASLPNYVMSRTGGIAEQRANANGVEQATVEDLLAALPAASASALLERLGTRGVLGLDDAVKGGSKGLAPAVGRAALTEGVTEALQGVIEYTGSSVGTRAGFDPAMAIDQALQGVAAGTPFGGVARAVTGGIEIATGRSRAEEQAAQRSEQDAAVFENLTQIAEASKLRERAPETFQQFVDHAAEGSPVENIYVDAATFAQSLNDAGIDINAVAEEIPSLKDQLPAALASGGDIRISAGEYAAKIAATEAGPALLDHLRADPFGMSRAQAADFMAQQGDQLKAEVEKAVAQGTADESFRASADVVRSKLADELNRAGRFTADVNNAYASLVSNFYAVTALKLGMTPEQMAERYPLRVSSELPTSAGRETLTQNDNMVELVHYSNASGLTASDPSQWGGTRATPDSERMRRNAGAPMRTYFGVRGVYGGESGVGIDRRRNVYTARVPRERLYDFDADPQGLKPTEGTAYERATAYEQAIQAAGFAGYRSDATVPGAVAMFEPTPLQATTVESYFSPENIGDLLSKTDWAVLTAENPRGEQAEPEANAAAQAKLEADLKAMGVDYAPAIGRYGQIENSFVVTRITEAQARELGAKYDQDSVLTHRGLIYQNGKIDPATGVTAHSTRPDDFFTEVPSTGALFTVDIDFEQASVAAFAQVAPEAALALEYETRIPTDPVFAEAIENTAGATLTEDGLVIDLVRFQKPSQGGDVSVRTGVFYLPTGSKHARHYKAGPNSESYGGPVRVEGQTLIRAPLFVKGSTGGKAPEVAYDTLKGKGAAAKLSGEVFSAINQRGWMKAQGDAAVWLEVIQGVLRDHDADPGMAADITRNSTKGNQLRYALQENIIAHAVRAAGHDAVVGYSKGKAGPFIAEVFDVREDTYPTPEGDFSIHPAFYQSQQPTFYSALLRAVEQSPTTKAPAAQWKATLAKTPGVKKEELEWSGLNEWLDLLGSGDVPPIYQRYVDAKGNIERETVMTFLRNGGVDIEEVVLGTAEVNMDSPYASTAVIAAVRGASTREDAVLQLEDDGTAYRVLQNRHPELFADDPEGWVDQVVDSVWREPPNTDGTAQFSGYKLPGADDTYRELLITLPGIDGPSTHWDEPNVVAHARFTERRDAAGSRVLFLEEVQSDWHQKGRDEGYANPGTPEQIEAARAAYEAVLNEQRATWADLVTVSLDLLDGMVTNDAVGQTSREMAAREADDIRDRDNRNPASAAIYASTSLKRWSYLATPAQLEVMDAVQALSLRATEARVALDALQGQGIPDAPFRTSWPALVMKRMIRYAVDHGYDKVAWINGNQQNGGQTGGDGSFFYERNLVNVTNELLKKYGARVEPVDFRDPASVQRVERATEGPALAAARESSLGSLSRPSQALGIQNGFTINDQLREAASQGFALFQPDRGQIAFGGDITQSPSVISLLQTADLSTFLHETGHFFLEVTAHIANAEDAPADIRADMDTVLSWFRPGLTLDQWNGMDLEQRRPFHEKFARGFEAYLFEGRAPSSLMRDLFRRFSAWLKNVYKTLTALDVTLTDDVRSVFDRMVASAEEIQAAEQARNFAPLFDTKPEGLTTDEWKRYQELGVDATAEAIETLEHRSARDMRWASGAKDRYVKQLQAEANDQRKAVRAEVTAEVMAEPVNRAREFLRRGVGENGEPVEGAQKLSLPALREAYGEDGQWTALRRGGKYGEVAEDGVHPDVVAEMFGYESGAALINDMVTGEIAADKIKGLTDQRMLERYGDLSDPQAVERAANEAVANDARAKFIAAEMAALDKAVGKRSILNEAARDFAASVVNRLELRRLKPAQYLAAQGRAAREAEKALKKDDLVAAATAKRNQLINLHTARAVQNAQKDVEKTTRLFTRIISAKDDSLAKTRNMDLVNAARAILATYGVGRMKNDPTAYMEALKAYDPTLYADLEPFVNGARGDAKPLGSVTYEQFQAVRDTVGQLWTMSRRIRQIEIDGQLMDKAVAVEALNTRLEEIGLPDNSAGLVRAVTDKEHTVRDLLGVRAALRRVESWARGVDGADQGPFRKYIWNPISTAADAYRTESGSYIRRFRDLLDTVRDELKPQQIAAPEIGYTFGGKAELYHAMLHTGNGSNKSKLLLGRLWARRTPEGMVDDSRWQALLDRLHAEGLLTAKDWNFVQSVWDLLEETKAGAQRAHRAVYGRYFAEVVADPVETPFGTYRGGYVPALTDAFLVQDAALRAEQEAIEGGDSAMFPAASNGFTKSRVEDYTRELALDLRLLPAHIDKVLKFTHLGPPVRDVARLLKDRGFSRALQAFDPVAQTDLLLPWLQRAAKQLVETPSKGRAGKAADRFFSAIRSRVGMQLMFANVVNTAQQVTGFSNVLLRVKAANVGAALWRYTRNPKGVADAAMALSPFLTNRSNTDIFEARQTITQLTKLNPNAKDQAVDFMRRHAYFMQSALQNVMDVVSWTAAFDQATARGDSQLEAVRFADSVIRETQGTMAPEDISRFETGTPFVRMFTQFAGYFNMMANLNATEVQQVARGIGARKGAGRLFYVYLMGFAVPALIGDAVAKALRGGWEDEDDDGYLDDLLAWFFSSQAKFALAAVPVVGQAANAAIGAFTDAPYDDRISMSPAVSVLESTAGVPAELYQSIVEGESFNRADVRDTLNLLGVLTGTPAGVLSKPAGYGVGVAQGDIKPTGPVDAARGAVTGAPSPESRQ